MKLPHKVNSELKSWKKDKVLIKKNFLKIKVQALMPRQSVKYFLLLEMFYKDVTIIDKLLKI